MYTTINGVEYPLATTLRVAYLVQGQHNHKPYTEVFKDIGDMSIEDQIGIIYCAFKCANTDSTVIMPKQNFIDYYLDNFTLKEVINQLQEIVKGIMGEDLIEEAADADAPANEGN